MRWDRRGIVATSFILLSLGSAIYLSTATLNYLNYFPATGQVQVLIDSVSIVPGSNYSRIDSRVTIANPTNYNGFRLDEAMVSMHFVNNTNAILFPASISVTTPIGRSLGPHSNVTTDTLIQLDSQDSRSLASFISAHGSRVMAAAHLTVEISTFLVSVLGRLYYSTSADLPLSIS